jgi:hypothetical protein
VFCSFLGLEAYKKWLFGGTCEFMNNLKTAYAAHGIGSNEANTAEQVCKDLPGGQGQKLIDGAKS